MKIVMFYDRKPFPQDVTIGNQYDNNAEQIQFVLPVYTGGTAYLHLHIGTYSDVVQLADGVYTVSRNHTQQTGTIHAHIEIMADGDVVWHSNEIRMFVGATAEDGEQIEQAYPTAIEQALANGQQVAADKLVVAGDRQAVEMDKLATEAAQLKAEQAEQGAAGHEATTRELAGEAGDYASAARASAEDAALRAGDAEAALEIVQGAADTETARQAAEKLRASAEDGRKSYETARRSSETQRKTAETGRTSAEAERATAEQSRAGAETQRTSSEQDRATAEAGRVAAEGARASSEHGRVSAETARIAAETQRSTAEANRVNAETGRASAEQSRATAEQNRASAEALRATAERQRQADTASAIANTNTAAASANNAAARANQATDDLITLGINIPARYGVVWDKVRATCTRIWDAGGIPTTTTNFAHNGSVNANYSNPFDTLYPWSGRKLCNIDLSLYRGLTTGADLRDCIVAWEGDPDYTYDHSDGVWVYTPEFWWLDQDNKDGRVLAVADGAIPGWQHAPATIGARWHGVAETRTVDGVSKQVLLSKPGIPCTRVSMASMHTYAGNAGLTLEDIYTYGIDWLLMAVEYATLNSQVAVGNGCSDLYRQGVQPVSVDGNTITIATSVAANYLPGAILEIGTTDGYSQIGRTYVVSKTVNATDTTLTDVVYAGDPLPITTAHYVSIHGTINATDAEIGSKSGYIGANYRCNAYYRGRVAHGNMHRYVLGAYRQQGTGHIWIAPNSNAADACDALDTAAHIDTGVSLPQGADGAAYDGYVNALAQLNAVPLPPICSSGGGSSSQPVGDYVYVPTLATVNTVLLAGGSAGYGSHCGRGCGNWSNAAGGNYWSISALPFLKSP